MVEELEKGRFCRVPDIVEKIGLRGEKVGCTGAGAKLDGHGQLEELEDMRRRLEGKGKQDEGKRGRVVPE